jgi:tRNA pseudouridine38-40 synthase
MKRRFKCTIEYDGTDFSGWQVQTNGRSVQGAMEGALRDLFQEDVRLHGAGRTDAGVHARGQAAHFDADTRLDPYTIAKALNSRLPGEITIRGIESVSDDFHARFSASSRSYVYTISQERISLGRSYSWTVNGALNHAAMSEAASCIAGTRDFTTFSKLAEDQTHCFCHVFEADWTRGEERSVFRVRANRFLTGMVRALVGGLVQVGRKRIPAEGFAALLEARNRTLTPMLAPPSGLVLDRVDYDPADYEFIRGIMKKLAAEHRIDSTKVAEDAPDTASE